MKEKTSVTLSKEVSDRESIASQDRDSPAPLSSKTYCSQYLRHRASAATRRARHELINRHLRMKLNARPKTSSMIRLRRLVSIFTNEAGGHLSRLPARR